VWHGIEKAKPHPITESNSAVSEMDDQHVDNLLQGIEDSLIFLANNIDPLMFLDSNSGNTDLSDINLMLENVVQQVVSFQPLLRISIPIITEMATIIKILVEELTVIEDEIQRRNRCRGDARKSHATSCIFSTTVKHKSSYNY